ncbi:MAG: 30S ribosomal protein S12 methylthiotransferase RimO [Desulfobacteraceae bacterium]|nr:30S ribosomal protein S12 methylthiotransferase RimO [Desulfobacteraceae bacterium]
MRVYLESLGCAKNQVDSEVMMARLAEAGWTLTDDPENAETIVVNTCSFIESAADESVDSILELSVYKQQGICTRLIVTGCLPERYREKIAEALPEVDLFLGTGAYERIVEAANGSWNQGICLLPDPDNIMVSEPDQRKPLNRHAAYLKVAEGCNRHCTYCIIPKLRGRQKSRPVQTLLAEAASLIGSGAKELTLVAQETTAYGRDLKPASDLKTLLTTLARSQRDVWLRFLYGHPESYSPDILPVINQFPNVCAYFDVPIQHGAKNVLRRMGRNYNSDDLRRLFDTIRQAVPDAVLRTTVITGFPGESGKDFNELLDLVQDIGFDHLGVFTYSDADDLASHKLDRHVDPELAVQRQAELIAVQQRISGENLQKYVGKQLCVLVEDKAEEHEGGYWIGRSQYQAPEVDGNIFIRPDDALQSSLLGQKVMVKVVESLDYDLVAVNC